jgi:hypothetical protein
MNRIPLILITLALLLSACAGPAADPGSTSTPRIDQDATQASPPPVEQTITASAAPALTATGPVVTITAAVTEGPGTNSVNVLDQKLGVGNTLTVDRVMAAQNYWIVIRADDNGQPGAVVGYAPVAVGENAQVVVTITDPDGITTPQLWAVLHADAGVGGKFEFPGTDTPVLDGSGGPVMESFNVTG